MKIDTRSRETLGRDTVVLKLKDLPNSTNINEILDGIDKIHNLYLDYIPQNVYKCFCKYAISLVDSSELPYFKDTINWINEYPTTKRRLPPIIPFCAKDKYRFVGLKRQEFFLNGLKEITNGKVDFQPTNLCGNKTIKLKMRTTFKIPDDCVEGRDYYFIDPADNEQRYSEESHSTESNAGVP